MKPFKNAADVKRRNKQAFKRLKELEEYQLVLRPMMHYESNGIHLTNQSPLTLRVKFEGSSK